jgi:hypothetical protein
MSQLAAEEVAEERLQYISGMTKRVDHVTLSESALMAPSSLYLRWLFLMS